MLLLQRDGYGVDKGIPTLLMAAGSFDDILAITGFSTCLGIAFSTGTGPCPLGSSGVLWGPLGSSGVLWVLRVLGVLWVLGVYMLWFCRFYVDEHPEGPPGGGGGGGGRHVVGFSGAGGLATLVLAFLAALGWKTDKVPQTGPASRWTSHLDPDPVPAPVAAMVGLSWDVFQPLLFGLIGAEITIKSLDPLTVGEDQV
ncbi:Mitochondrial sodium/hydrogen exchanger 9B2 [Liparis tanakae]|uniref:Mitochondrial sodium/hydrogen exchanger 9B2 n=1 Tax=Liparis tanakae TaxID=230148 RepID=A0A4Z2E1M5_9TELE|nr:Mitochondrial sodium/hydrogen exchanger 9B2 [Liparis tanakae]